VGADFSSATEGEDGVVKASELHPKHPERICWGCDRYCAAADLGCGNGTIRTPHPAELFGDDWNAGEAASSESRAPSPVRPD
jgi:hypothetical protein